MPTPHTRVRVWDLPTRLFHWILVGAVAVAAFTGFLGPKSWLDIHVYAGTVVGAAVLFRLVWGVFGAEPSRFASFVFGPAAVVDHLKALAARRPHRFWGHNPAGAAMIFALLAALAVVVATGVVTLGGVEKQGVLKGVAPYALGRDAREIHETVASLLLILVLGHLAGVAVESRLGRERLVRAMVTGDKDLPAGESPPRLAAARPLAALAALIVVAAAVGWPAWRLAALPPLGVRALAVNPVYHKECGDCHDAFHPSLLPAPSWVAVMTSLDRHFGEDARLPAGTAAALTGWLTANAAETFDTKAANRVRRVAADEPRRITATPWWKHQHEDLPAAAFTQPKVKSKANCSACHRDADTGRFDPQAIHPPTGGASASASAQPPANVSARPPNTAAQPPNTAAQPPNTAAPPKE